MTEAPVQPVLQKPPGYRDPDAPPPLPKPPQRRPLPPSMYQKKKRRTCCCCFCLFLLIVVVLIVAAGAIFYLWYHPKVPAFHFQSFQVTQFNLTINSDGTYLDAKTVSRVEVKNPNERLGLYYGNTQVTVNIGGGDDETELGSTTVPAFAQRKHNVTSLKVETQGRKEVPDGSAPRLRSGYKNGNLPVKVNVRTGVGFRVEGWRLGTLAVAVKCGDTSLKGLQGGDTPKCTINVLRWINIH